MVRINLRRGALGVGPAAIGPSQEKRGEGAAAGERRRAGHARPQKAEARLARNLLLADSGSPLALKRVAELECVLAAGVAEIIFDSPHRLLGPVEGGAAPALKFAERNEGEVHGAVDDVFHAQLALPVTAGDEIRAFVRRK